MVLGEHYSSSDSDKTKFPLSFRLVLDDKIKAHKFDETSAQQKLKYLDSLEKWLRKRQEHENLAEKFDKYRKSFKKKSEPYDLLKVSIDGERDRKPDTMDVDSSGSESENSSSSAEKSSSVELKVPAEEKVSKKETKEENLAPIQILTVRDTAMDDSVPNNVETGDPSTTSPSEEDKQQTSSGEGKSWMLENSTEDKSPVIVEEKEKDDENTKTKVASFIPIEWLFEDLRKSAKFPNIYTQ